MKTQFNIFETLRVTLSTHRKSTLLFMAAWITFVLESFFLAINPPATLRAAVTAPRHEVGIMLLALCIIVFLVMCFYIFIQETPEFTTTYLKILEKQKKSLEQQVAKIEAKESDLEMKNAKNKAQTTYDDKFSHLNNGL